MVALPVIPSVFQLCGAASECYRRFLFGVDGKYAAVSVNSLIEDLRVSSESFLQPA